MKTVTRYQAEDGALFRNEEQCREHEAQCLRTEGANALLQGGSSLAHVLDHYRGRGILSDWLTAEDCADLKEITKDTALVISHWQCRDEPGYRVIRIELNGQLFVHGHAGSWSGPYGSKVNLSDLLRHYRDTKRALAQKQEGKADG